MMSSLMEKLRAAKAMQGDLVKYAKEAETELKVRVEATPEIEGDMPTGPAQSINNQESPMAKLRAKMAAKKEGLAEPTEATKAAKSLNGTVLKVAPTVYEQPKPVNPITRRTVEAAQTTEHALDRLAREPEHVEPKLSLKEKLALKKEKQAEEQHHRVMTSKIPTHSKATIGPETARVGFRESDPMATVALDRKEMLLALESAGKQGREAGAAEAKAKPAPKQWLGVDRIRAEQRVKADQASTEDVRTVLSIEGAEQAKVDMTREAKVIRREQAHANFEQLVDTEAKLKTPEPAPSAGGGLLAKLKAKKAAAKAALEHAPTTSSNAVDKSMENFTQNQLPAQPTNASAGSLAQVKIKQTGIQGSPQVKELEESYDPAANRQAVTLNAKQEETATLYVKEGKSCVMVGAAGTGKTTGVRGVLQRLLDEERLLYNADYKRQGGAGLKDRVTMQPNVAICAFTRRAAINIMESVTSQTGLEDFKWCCQTIHNLLEFAPEYYESYDDETGEWVQKMRFAPNRHANAKIDCNWLIIEEASMVDLNLWEKLLDALLPGTKILFLGDINQLPPVFGLPILVYAMLKLPVVELTEVYRQSVGPVLRNAHNILKGIPLEEQEEGDQAFLCYEEYKTEKGGTSLKRHSADKGSPIMAGETKMSSLYTVMFRKLFEAGRYDPDTDMIISPFNVNDLGTLHMNQCLAQFIGDARGAVVHEIIAGFNKHYLAVGDKVMVERQDGSIISIHHNSDYMGSLPKQSGNDLSRFGVRIMGRNSEDGEVDLDEVGDVNFDLAAIAEKTAEELKRAASHIITVMLESGEEVVLSNSGQFAPEKFTLGYCLTGHKSQGSEWRNVYVIMHKKHHSLLTREWLYTVATRARKQCTMLCKPYSIEKALASQRIAGDTIEDKLAWFTSGAVDNLDEIQVTV